MCDCLEKKIYSTATAIASTVRQAPQNGGRRQARRIIASGSETVAVIARTLPQPEDDDGAFVPVYVR